LLRHRFGSLYGTKSPSANIRQTPLARRNHGFSAAFRLVKSCAISGSQNNRGYELPVSGNTAFIDTAIRSPAWRGHGPANRALSITADIGNFPETIGVYHSLSNRSCQRDVKDAGIRFASIRSIRVQRGNRFLGANKGWS
jgi:hypothetical protein